MVLKYFDDLTKKLGRIESSPFRVHVIRYLFGNKMGRHGDGLQKTERYGGCRMCLVLNLGDSRKIRFSANILDTSQINAADEGMPEASNQSGKVYPNFFWEMETTAGLSAYLMSSHGNGGCFLCYTDETKKFVLQAQHEVPNSGMNDRGSTAWICDFLVSDIIASMNALEIMKKTVL